MDSKQKRIVLGIAGACVLFVVISAALKNPTPQTPGITQQPVTTENQSSASPPPVTAPVQPAPPTHNYAMEEDGEYGYEGALSKNDQDAGKSVNPILMFRYLGEKNGTYSVQAKDGQMMSIASCKDKCEFIKFQTFFAGQLVKTETVRSTGTAVIDAVLQDALNGQLKKYKAPSKS